MVPAKNSRLLSFQRGSCAVSANPAYESFQEPDTGHDDNKPRNDGSDGFDQCGKAITKIGAEFAECFGNGGECAAFGRVNFRAEGYFDCDFFCFICQILSQSGFGIEFGLRFGQLFLNLQEVCDVNTGFYEHPAQTVAEFRLIFDFCFDIDDRCSFVLGFGGVLRDFSLLPREVEQFVEVLRKNPHGNTTRGSGISSRDRNVG